MTNQRRTKCCLLKLSVKNYAPSTTSPIKIHSVKLKLKQPERNFHLHCRRFSYILILILPKTFELVYSELFFIINLLKNYASNSTSLVKIHLPKLEL